jgi:hypothetical protein
LIFDIEYWQSIWIIALPFCFCGKYRCHQGFGNELPETQKSEKIKQAIKLGEKPLKLSKMIFE